VVIAITLVVVVVSVLFVFPRFKDWGKLQRSKHLARATLLTNQTEIARRPEYQAQLERPRLAGSLVLPAEQAVDLTRTVQSKAQEKGVAITGTRPATLTGAGGSTNQFFDEQIVSIDISALDKEIVDFLVSLGSGDSMIRVRDMDLRPDPPQFRLLGKLTLVASYQKKPKTAASTGPPRVGVSPPAPRPATNAPATPKGST